MNHYILLNIKDLPLKGAEALLNDYHDKGYDIRFMAGSGNDIAVILERRRPKRKVKK